MVTNIRRLFSDTHSPTPILRRTVSSPQSPAHSLRPPTVSVPDAASAQRCSTPAGQRPTASAQTANVQSLSGDPACKPSPPLPQPRAEARATHSPQPTTDSPKSEVNNPQPGNVGNHAPPDRHTAAPRHPGIPASRHPSASASQHLSTLQPTRLPTAKPLMTVPQSAFGIKLV